MGWPRPIRRKVTINDIPTLLRPALEKSFTKENIASAYRATGIYPFNREVVLAKVRKESAQEHRDDDSNVSRVHMPGTESGNMPWASRLEISEEVLEHPSALTETWPSKKHCAKLPYCGLMRLKDYVRNTEQRDMEKEDKAATAMRRNEEKKRVAAAKKTAAAAKKRSKKGEGNTLLLQETLKVRIRLPREANL